MNVLKYRWCELNQLIFSSCFEVYMWYPKISSSRSLHKGLVLYPAKNAKSIALFHTKIFSCYVTLLLKRKLQHVGHKWVICGSHPDCSVGQMDQKV